VINVDLLLYETTKYSIHAVDHF